MKTPVCSALLAGSLLCLSTLACAEPPLSIEQIAVEDRVEINSSRLAYGHDAIWARSGFDVVRLDQDDLEASMAAPIPPLFRTRDLGVSEDAAWVADGRKGILYKLDPTTADLLLEVPVRLTSRQSGLAFSEGVVWVLSANPEDPKGQLLTGLDSETGERRNDFALPAGGVGIVYHQRSLWVTQPTTAQLLRVDATDGTILSTTDLGGWPGPATLGDGALWVYNLADATVQRIDLATGELAATIFTSLPKTPEGLMVYGDGNLWLGPVELKVLSQVDTSKNEERRVITGTKFRGLAFGEGALWISDGSAIIRLSVVD